MTFVDIPAGTRLFVDANVMTYYLLRVMPFYDLCDPLFRKAARREVFLHTSASVAADVIHRAMLSEAIARYNLPPREVVGFLKTHPDMVRQLEKYKQVPGWFTQARIDILPVTYQEIHGSKLFRDNYGLLANDSILLAVMARERLTDLATNDPDFRRVPGIRLWTPTE